MIATANIRDSYKFYKKNVDEPVKVKIYIYIILGFIKFFMSKVFEGKDVKLPAKLGVIGVRGRKVKPKLNKDGEIIGLAPNWPETKKLWKRNPVAKEKKELVYCFNEHSNGLRYKLIWFKKNVLFQHKMVYSILFSRSNKRVINVNVKNKIEYLVKH